MTLEILTFETAITATNHTVFMKRNVIYVNIHYARHGMRQIIIFHHRKILRICFYCIRGCQLQWSPSQPELTWKHRISPRFMNPWNTKGFVLKKNLLNLWDQKSPGKRTIKSICWAVWWLLHVFVSQVAIHIFKLNGSILPASYVVECPSRSIRIPPFHRHRGAGTSC